MKKNDNLSVWEIKKIQWSKGKGTEIAEYVAAPDLKQVLDYISGDVDDSAVEIISLSKIVPLTTTLV